MPKKISNETEENIFQGLWKGYKQMAIAEEEGVSDSTVGSVKRKYPLFFGLMRKYEEDD
jgi:transposase